MRVRIMIMIMIMIRARVRVRGVLPVAVLEQPLASFRLV